MKMIETLKSAFQSEKKILESEATIAEKEYGNLLARIDKFKQEAAEKKVRVSFLSENEQKYLTSLVQDGRPICPRCLVRFDKTHFMSTSPGNAKFEYFSCKICGFEIEIEI